jgi:hypothetical protein
MMPKEAPPQGPAQAARPTKAAAAPASAVNLKPVPTLAPEAERGQASATGEHA